MKSKRNNLFMVGLLVISFCFVLGGVWISRFKPEPKLLPLEHSPPVGDFDATLRGH